jgi:hypothetical protein
MSKLETISIEDFPNLFTKQRCEQEVEYYQSLGLSLVDSLLEISKKYQLEPEDMAKFLSKQMKAKLYDEAQRLNLLSKKTK